MNWDIVLYTRNKAKDYSWFLRPDYLEKDVGKIRSILSDIRYKLTPTDNLNDTIKKTFFYHRTDESVGIYRVLYDVGTDHVGRSITAFEGIVSPIGFLRDFIMDIPNILLYLLQQDDIVDRTIREEELSETIDIPDVINPFFTGPAIECAELQPEVFSHLLDDIKYYRINSDFLLGPAADAYRGGLREVCDNIIVYNDRFTADKKSLCEDDNNLMGISQNRYLNGRIGIAVRITPKQVQKKEEKDERFEFQWVVFKFSDDGQSITSLYSFYPIGMKTNYLIYDILNDLSYIDAFLLYLGWIKEDDNRFIYQRVLEQ